MKKIGIWGSCISRDVFTTYFNKDYKNFFEVTISSQRSTIISVMQEKQIIDTTLLNPNQNYYDSNVLSKYYQEDLEKTFLYDLLAHPIDYLIIDVNFDVANGILFYDYLGERDRIMTNIKGIQETNFFKQLTNVREFNIFNNSEEFYEIWCQNTDLFFDYIHKNCPNTKIVLAEVRAVDRIERADKSVYVDTYFTERKKIYNPLFKKLEDYIKRTQDVYVIKFDEDTLCNENHRWGKFYVHYYNQYYYDYLEKIKCIIEYDQLYSQHESMLKSSINYNKCQVVSKEDIEFLNRLINRLDINNEILNNKTNSIEPDMLDLLEKHKSKIIENEISLIEKLEELYSNTLNSQSNVLENFSPNLFNSLKKFNMARVDMKNMGSEENDFSIIINDKNAIIRSPEWFRNKEGIGRTIQSFYGHLKFKIKVKNDGTFTFFLRTADTRDKNKKPFPIYINYTKFIVNGEDIINENNLVWHNSPYIYKKQVKNNDELDVYIEWQPFDNDCVFKF